jgi:acyl-CoA thioesterase-1
MLRIVLLLISLTFIPQVYAQPVIMVFGDSLSAGFGLPNGKGWVNLLQQRIDSEKRGYEVINASISGDTTSGGVRRIDQALRKHHPVLVIVELGGNDGLRGLSLKEMQNNLELIIKKIKKTSAQVLLVGMQLPPNYGLAYTRRFEKTYIKVAESEDVPLVPFLVDGIESDMSYFQADRIHPNTKGQPVMLNNVWQKLAEMI